MPRCRPTSIARTLGVFSVCFSPDGKRIVSGSRGFDAQAIVVCSWRGEGLGRGQGHRCPHSHATHKHSQSGPPGAVRLPAIAHLRDRHYVTVFELRAGSVVVGDPAKGIGVRPYFFWMRSRAAMAASRTSSEGSLTASIRAGIADFASGRSFPGLKPSGCGRRGFCP